MAKTPTQTREELEEAVRETLNDPKLLEKIYTKDLSKFTKEDLADFYQYAYLSTKLKLFGKKGEIV